MRRIALSLAVFAVVAAAALTSSACSTVTTSADYDPKTDFSRYSTWAWRDDGSIKDPILSKRVQSALEDELAKRGLKRNDQSPDLWVAVHARLSKQVQVDTYNAGWGYGYGWYGGTGMTSSTVREIPVGTLIVDFADANRKELVWRGTASDTLNPEKSPEEKDKALRAALAELFTKYPPPKKG
jgi:hypothetical protein